MIVNRMLEINHKTKVISDTHFSHKNILNFEPCRLSQMRLDGYNDDEHDEWLIEQWNSSIKADELIVHLGDFAFKQVAETLEKLNGRIILILGNHDGSAKNTKYQKSKFHKVLVVDGTYIVDFQNSIISKIMNEDEKISSIITNLKFGRVMFSHYALFNNGEWDRKNPKIAPRIEVLEDYYKSFKCDYNIHGHLHSAVSSYKGSINCSIEHTNFKPKRIKELM